MRHLNEVLRHDRSSLLPDLRIGRPVLHSVDFHPAARPNGRNERPKCLCVGARQHLLLAYFCLPAPVVAGRPVALDPIRLSNDISEPSRGARSQRIFVSCQRAGGGIVQYDGDSRRLECCRALDGQVQRRWRSWFDPVAQAAETAISF
jgi:hypothetical protein